MSLDATWTASKTRRTSFSSVADLSFCVCLFYLFGSMRLIFPFYRWQQGPLISGDENITLMLLLFRGRREIRLGAEEMEKEEKGGREMGGRVQGWNRSPPIPPTPVPSGSPRITLAMRQPLILGFQSMFGTHSASLPHEFLFVCLDPSISVVLCLLERQ